MTEQYDKILTLTEVAHMLRVPHNSLYQWRTKGYGPPAAKIGKHLRYRRSEVYRWLAEQEAEQ